MRAGQALETAGSDARCEKPFGSRAEHLDLHWTLALVLAPGLLQSRQLLLWIWSSTIKHYRPLGCRDQQNTTRSFLDGAPR